MRKIALIILCTVFMLNVPYVYAQLSCYHFVLDAGHGGSDPGSYCSNGVAEKVLTLQMCQKLQSNLSGKGATVSMTRSTDIYVSLTDRRDFINNENPDAAVSMHLNAYNAVVQGTETFWCAGTPSSTLAGIVQPLLVATIGFNNRGVKNTCFTVLTTNSAIPTILTESVFHDEPSGCSYINSQTNQTAVAEAHATGIQNYLPACTNATNDLCENAILLQSQLTCIYTLGSLSGASANSFAKPSCDGFSNPAREDVFYTFFAVDTVHTIEINPTGTGADAVDAVLALYSGTNCNTLTEVACTGGTGGSGGITKTLIAGNLTPGQKYWIRLYDYGTIDPVYPGFELCVTHTNVISAVNPAEDSFNVQFSTPTEGMIQITADKPIGSISMLDITGKLLLHKESDGNESLFDTNNLPCGLYCIRVLPVSSNYRPVVLKYLHTNCR